MSTQQPKVGLGVIVVNEAGKFLVMKRKGSHAPYWSIPGGKLELGETFENGAVRELKEELDIIIIEPQVIAVTNNLKTYDAEGVHFISVILVAKSFTGVPEIMEPTKCTEVRWVSAHNLPQPHFEASEAGVRCFLNNVSYVNAFA